jgi:lipid-binding SYLF domain-containing protein
MMDSIAIGARRISRQLVAALALAAFVVVAGPSRADAIDQEKLVAHAKTSFDRMRSDAGFRAGNDILRRAAAVIIVPELTKGAIIVGGQAGEGVLLARTPGGGWSYPAFYTIGSASVGLQIGFEQAEVVVFVMRQSALDMVLNEEVTFGGKAGLSALFVGKDAENQLTKPDTDFIVWAKSKGAYAGITAEGTFIKPNDGASAEYYGSKLTALQIVQGSVRNPSADSLRDDLASR